MKKKINQNNKLKIIGFSVLGLAVCSSAIVTPFLLKNNEPHQSLNVNFSNTYEGNANRIDYFLSDSENVSQSKLINQLKIKEKYNYVDRSFITINEAWDNGNKDTSWFEFDFYSTFKYSLYKNNLDAKLAYIKPNETNSTYPVVGLKIFAGSGSTYAEKIFEYSEPNINGFKQSNEEINTNNIIENINKNPSKYFVLNKDKGKIGDLGLYAKNIKSTDFDLINNKTINELKKYNYTMQITSIEADKIIPSNLNLTYSIEFNDGNILFRKTYQKVVIKGFDIELGKDDPKSKVENFIKDNKTTLDSLKQFFILNIPNNEKDFDIRKAYENGWIEFKPSSSNISALTNVGLSIEFKKYIPNQEGNKLNVFANEDDSQSPMYRIYITSYKDTPLEYTSDYIIKGDEDKRFKISENQLNIEKLDKILNDANLLYNDFFEIDKIFFTQDGPFNGKEISQIPFAIVEKAYQLWREDNNKHKQPFDVKIKQKAKIDLPPSITQEDKQFINSMIPKIVTSINNMPLGKKIPLDKNIGLDNGLYQLTINVGLGENENNLFVSLNDELLLPIPDNLFMNPDAYYQNQVIAVFELINSNNKLIQVVLSSSENTIINEYNAIQYIKTGEWNKIFSKAVILNGFKIEYPDFDTNVNVEINFDKLNILNEQQRNEIIKRREIEITFNINKGVVFKQISIKFNFDNLFGK